MDLSELAMRLGVDDAALAAKAESDRVSSFMGSYGDRFNNNQNIGMAILNSLPPDLAQEAMADAVQNVLDTIRSEAQQLLNDTQAANREMMSKIDDISAGVSAATGAPPGGEAPVMPPTEGLPPIAPPLDMGIPPPMEGELPMGAEAPMPVDIPPAGAAPGGEVPLAPPPAPIPSDARVKNIRAAIKSKAPAQSVWRPPSHLMSAINGGRG